MLWQKRSKTLSFEEAGLMEAKFQAEPPWFGEMKVGTLGHGRKSTFVVMPMYGKTP